MNNESEPQWPQKWSPDRLPIGNCLWHQKGKNSGAMLVCTTRIVDQLHDKGSDSGDVSIDSLDGLLTCADLSEHVSYAIGYWFALHFDLRVWVLFWGFLGNRDDFPQGISLYIYCRQTFADSGQYCGFTVDAPSLQEYWLIDWCVTRAKDLDCSYFSCKKKQQLFIKSHHYQMGATSITSGPYNLW